MSNQLKNIKKNMKPEPTTAPSMWEQMTAFNVFEHFGHLFQEGWFLDPDTLKITCNQHVDQTKKWMFVNPDPDMLCNLYQDIWCKCAFIPERCIGCWKVVVKMHTIEQLWNLWKFQQEFTKGYERKDRFCKCGIEERTWVRYQYGGYFYTSSKEEGLKRKAELKAALASIMPLGNYEGGGVEIILKRGCTEMELGTCASTDYVKTDFHRYCEAKVLAIIDRPKVNPKPPQELIEFILIQWMRYAWKINDMTVKKFNGGKDLYGSCVAYGE